MFIANNSGVFIDKDQQTVYSIQCNEQNKNQVISKENLKTNESQIITKIPDNFFVESLLLNEEQKTIIVSGACLEKEQSLVNEYDISTGKLLSSKSFDDTKIVMELLKTNNLCLMGCSDNFLKIMNKTTPEVQIDSVKTALGIIFSM